MKVRGRCRDGDGTPDESPSERCCLASWRATTAHAPKCETRHCGRVQQRAQFHVSYGDNTLQSDVLAFVCRRRTRASPPLQVHGHHHHAPAIWRAAAMPQPQPQPLTRRCRRPSPEQPGERQQQSGRRGCCHAAPLGHACCGGERATRRPCAGAQAAPAPRRHAQARRRGACPNRIAAQKRCGKQSACSLPRARSRAPRSRAHAGRPGFDQCRPAARPRARGRAECAPLRQKTRAETRSRLAVLR